MVLPRRTLVACLILASLLIAQTDLTGFWVFRVPTGDGNFRDLFFEWKQTGETLTGAALTDSRKLPISRGTVKNGKVHFTIVRVAENRTVTSTYDGTLDGKRVQMTAVRPDETVHGVFERSTPEAAAPPARLPLPPLHDVPDNGLVRTPPLGWNSWNKFAGRVDDKTVREMADAMVASGMKAAGYVYVNIDDTWEGQRDAKGNITTNRKFPDMKALADYVHSKGLKIGIYSSPGPKTCAGYEGSYGHEQQDANTYAAWGFDYLKYDWCSASRIYKDEEMQPVYQKMGDALLKTGRPIVFSLCQYGRNDVWKWGAKVGGNLWRTTGDIGDHWKSMDEIGFRQIAIAPFAKPGHWNDPDMLEVGNGGMTPDEYRTHMSLWALLAAPLLAGNDLRSMSAETRAMLVNAEVIAIDQDRAAQPVQLVSEKGSSEVLMRPLGDHSVAVGLFNRGSSAVEMSVSLNGKTHIRDLWEHRDVPAAGDGLKASVPAHGVVLLRLK